MGVRALKKIQLGQETTAGTAVVATTIWRGKGVLTDARELVEVEEDIGQLVPLNRMYESHKFAEVKLNETPATFEQLPYLPACGVESVVTGVADGTGGGKIYAYDIAVTATQAPKTLTIEVGDNNRVDEAEYAYVSEWSLAGASREALMMEATLQARQATDAEFTGSLSAPAVEEILFGEGKLYIDTTTIGTTQQTTTWLGFKLDMKTGHAPLFSGDGETYFSTIVSGAPEVTGEITLLHDAFAEAEIAAARAQTTRLVRMIFEGSAVTSGTTYTKKTLKIDLGVVYTKVPETGEQDEQTIVTLPFRMVYHTTAAVGGQITVVNTLATLP